MIWSAESKYNLSPDSFDGPRNGSNNKMVGHVLKAKAWNLNTFFFFHSSMHHDNDSKDKPALHLVMGNVFGEEMWPERRVAHQTPSSGKL
jgi:hypothetical protein